MPHFRPRPRPRQRCPRRHPKLSFESLYPKRTDGLCRCGCGEKLEGRQRHWRKDHEKHPLELFDVARGRSDTIRKLLAERDCGICALCGMNTVEAAAASGFAGEREPGADLAAVQAMRARFMAMGFPAPGWGRDARRCHWWQADHTVPLIEGGTNTLENLRTLCIRCHRRETTALAGRISNRRRGLDPVLELAFC